MTTSSVPETTTETGSDGPGRGRWLLTALLGGMFLGNIDIAIVNVAAPAIGDDLGASGAALELVVSGYTLAFAMLLVAGARLGDLKGYRPIYLIGLAVFTGASLLCGLAPTVEVLIGARIVQGVGAALMISQVLLGIQLSFRGAARSRALGLYAAVLAGSAVVGQVLGGLIVSADLFGTSWRPIFLINVPIGIALYLVSVAVLPRTGGSGRRTLDLPGVAVLSSALLLLTLPLVLGRDEGWPLWTWLSLAASVVLFVVFVVVERRTERRGGSPLVAIPLLSRPTVALALVSQAATRASYFALLFVLALYLQVGLGRSAAYSGLALVAWVAAFGVAGPVLGRLGHRAKQVAAPAGTALLAVAFALMALTAAASEGGVVLIVLLGLGGLGYGAAFSGTLNHLSSGITDKYAADVSGVFNTVLQVGGTLGIAIFGSVYLAGAGRPGPASTSAFGVTATAFAVTCAVAAVLVGLAVRTTATPPADDGAPAGR